MSRKAFTACKTNTSFGFGQSHIEHIPDVSPATVWDFVKGFPPIHRITSIRIPEIPISWVSQLHE